MKIPLTDGVWLDPMDPDPDLFTPEMIAERLSRLNRYSGGSPYTVASHCADMADDLDAEGISLPTVRAALWHDAAESVYGDMPLPLKIRCPEYERMHDLLMFRLSRKFNFLWPVPEMVRELDAEFAEAEARHYLGWKSGWSGILPGCEPRFVLRLESPFRAASRWLWWDTWTQERT